MTAPTATEAPAVTLTITRRFPAAGGKRPVSIYAGGEFLASVADERAARYFAWVRFGDLAPLGGWEKPAAGALLPGAGWELPEGSLQLHVRRSAP